VIRVTRVTVAGTSPSEMLALGRPAGEIVSTANPVTG